MLRIVIWLGFFGDRTQSEKLSEIKPPSVVVIVNLLENNAANGSNLVTFKSSLLLKFGLK